MYFVSVSLLILTIVLLIKFFPVSIKNHIGKNKKKYIIGLVIILVIFIKFKLIDSGTFDHSVEVQGMTILWNNNRYIESGGKKYRNRKSTCYNSG